MQNETEGVHSDAEPDKAWKRQIAQASLPEVYRSIAVPMPEGGAKSKFIFWRKLLAFAGPGFLVAVGYMDPGNWATGLEGGAKYGYTLLSVILLSNLMAMLFQHLCVKLGIVTERDLAQACRDHYSKPVAYFLWILSEIAIVACDLAEVVGSAIGLKLLFGIPLVWGCIITGADVLLLLWLQKRGFRWVEAIVVTLIATIGVCFAAELFLAKPDMGGIVRGFVPDMNILRDGGMLYVAIGIIGATVMPHNLYLHSSIVQTRDFKRTPDGKREAIKFATIDVTLALTFAFFINAAILILAAAAFHNTEHAAKVTELEDACELLTPVLGTTVAGTLFAVALLASGQNSTLTGTLAGQIVMEGFLNFRIAPWLRRMITRVIAIVPAVLVIALFGEEKTMTLLIGSQVVLSMQLGFAMWPLMRFTNAKEKMGEFVNRPWLAILGWVVTALIIALNGKLIVDAVSDLAAPDKPAATAPATTAPAATAPTAAPATAAPAAPVPTANQG